jgi:hypothetical protein
MQTRIARGKTHRLWRAVVLVAGVRHRQHVGAPREPVVQQLHERPVELGGARVAGYDDDLELGLRGSCREREDMRRDGRDPHGVAAERRAAIWRSLWRGAGLDDEVGRVEGGCGHRGWF